MTEIKAKLAAFLGKNGADTDAADFMTRPLREMIDSVDMIAFIAFIEETFAITIDDDCITPDNFANPAAIVDFIRRPKVRRPKERDQAGGGPDVKIERISFAELKQYWIEVDHFHRPDKKIREVVRTLGPHTCKIEDPRRQSYGMFLDDGLIGVTHLVQWDCNWLRYRTLNIREPYQGPDDLGWKLLRRAVHMDWRDWKVGGRYLFSWARRSHVAWSLAHGFETVTDTWHGEHIAMRRPLLDM
jgi:acyl carrier protein